MKLCEWCDESMKKQNYNRHQGRCIFKNDLGMKKTDILNIKQNIPIVKENKEIDIALSELKNYLTDTYNKTYALYKRIIQNSNMTPIQRLREMHVSEPTKNNYIREWKLYTKWLTKTEKSVDRETANTYLAGLKCKPSTLRKKQLILQNILQFLIDPNIKLNKVSMRISVIPKYPMTNEEIIAFLDEQADVDFEDYLIQKLMLTYGLRINSVAALKRKHLVFMDGEQTKIFLPDSKVKKERFEEIDDELMGLFYEFIEEEKDDEDYIFYAAGNKFDDRKRAFDIGLRINKRIKNSKVLRKNRNFKYTSHMFRKTKAFNLYQEGVAKLKERARAAIGESSGSTSIESYIHN